MIRNLFIDGKNINMKVSINTSKLSQNKYIEWIDNTKHVWDVSSLIKHVEENKYEEFDLPLAGISLDLLPWKVADILDYIRHYKRISVADLNFPILLSDRGIICDGWHRICKALIEGKENIKAIRIQEMPEAHIEESS